MTQHQTQGWGVVKGEGVEIWDANPIFSSEHVTWKDKMKLLFYPKRFVLFSAIAWDVKKKHMKGQTKYRILDVGCGTGAALIDIKRLFGKQVEVVGIDVVNMQVQIAKSKLKEHGVWANVHHFNGRNMSFDSDSFDCVYTSDVLGHVEDVPFWLAEIHRVLKPGGLLAMFSESAIGKHAWIRKYLYERGLNVDPHGQFHISLYSKRELRRLIEKHFVIKKMLSTVWLKFLVHPDELAPALQGQQNFFFLRHANRLLFWAKKKTHPYSMAAAEFYSLIELLTLGRFIDAQGFVIVAKNKP